jgi:DNA-binding MurR/RpiR family transcriptional regulator
LEIDFHDGGFVEAAMTPRGRRDQLFEEMRRRFATLSPRLRQAARHILDHPTRAALDTVTELGREAGVQPSVLVRLAKAFGFAGFSDMQAVLRSALAAAAPSYGERLLQLSAASAGAGTPWLLEQAVALNQVSLQNLLETVDAAALERAAGLIADAALVHVLGIRRSYPIAGYITYGLTRSGKSARLLAGAAGMLRDEVETMRPGDVLVVVCQPPYAAEAIEAAAWAAGRGVAVVALTDGELSPLREHATVLIDVRDAELFGFRALVAEICLAQVLVLGALKAGGPPTDAVAITAP